jgi:glycosyltransferase involved in cell wall biosynthesis
MKIAIYSIAKNEEKFCERFVKSCKDADGIFVADTGSTDNSVELLRSLGAIVSNITLDWSDWPPITSTEEWRQRLGRPWRFDVARNKSLAIVPNDYDLCICLDLDEILIDGWRACIEKVWNGAVSRLRYHYTWSWKAPGIPDLVYWGDKIHARHDYEWRHPVHEVLYRTNNKHETQAWCDLRIEHYPDSTKSRGQYFPLLEASVAENPENDRNAYYLGREYFFYGRHDDAIKELKRHLSLSSALWKAERAASMRYIAKCYAAKNNKDEQLAYIRHACAEAPGEREPWVELAQFFYDQRDYLGCYYAAKQALKIETRPPVYMTEAFAWGERPYDLAGVAACYVGLLDESRKLITEAWQRAPNDERLINNVKFVRKEFAVPILRSRFKVILLWPTVRPLTFNKQVKLWVENASNKDDLFCITAVNTKQQAEQIEPAPYLKNPIIVGDERRGVTHATHQLASSDFGGIPGDIVILASDDFYPILGWDDWVKKQMLDYNGCLLVNDGWQTGNCVTIPIMDYSCLVRLNKIIYHPAYFHQYSDNELYDNLNELKLLKNLRSADLVFEHKHWHSKKRDKDGVDEIVYQSTSHDYQLYTKRSQMSLNARLIV